MGRELKELGRLVIELWLGPSKSRNPAFIHLTVLAEVLVCWSTSGREVSVRTLVVPLEPASSSPAFSLSPPPLGRSRGCCEKSSGFVFRQT